MELREQIALHLVEILVGIKPPADQPLEVSLAQLGDDHAARFMAAADYVVGYTLAALETARLEWLHNREGE